MSWGSDLVELLVTHLPQARDQLNELDGFAGDGDLGLTAATACAAIEEVLPGLATAPPSELLQRLGVELSRRASSTSGTLVAFGLLAAGRECAAREPTRSAESLARILRVISTTIAARGRSAAGDKTMIDALEPAVAASESAAADGASVAMAARAAAEAASLGAAATSAMTPQRGRASWLAGRSVGHEDAGARAVAIVLSILATGLENICERMNDGTVC